MSDLLSGALGGVIVFVLTMLWTEIRDGRRRVRAYMGYARLLRTEVRANSFALSGFPTPMQYEEATEQWLREAIKRQTMEAVEEDPEEHPVAWSVIDPFERVELLIPTWRDALSSEAWRGVREPLAPLIAHTDFAALDRHYRELDWFLAQLHGMSNDDPKTRFSYLSSLAETKGKLEVQMRKLLENVLPNYTEPHWFKQRFGL